MNPGPSAAGDGEPALSGALCRAYNNWIAAMQLIAGGVLEKLPTLKVAFVESGAG